MRGFCQEEGGLSQGSQGCQKKWKQKRPRSHTKTQQQFVRTARVSLKQGGISTRPRLRAVLKGSLIGELFEERADFWGA